MSATGSSTFPRTTTPPDQRRRALRPLAQVRAPLPAWDRPSGGPRPRSIAEINTYVRHW